MSDQNKNTTPEDAIKKALETIQNSDSFIVFAKLKSDDGKFNFGIVVNGDKLEIMNSIKAGMEKHQAVDKLIEETFIHVQRSRGNIIEEIPITKTKMPFTGKGGLA